MYEKQDAHDKTLPGTCHGGNHKRGHHSSRRHRSGDWAGRDIGAGCHISRPRRPGQPAAGTGSTGSTGAASSGTAAANPNAWKKVNGAYRMPDGTSISNVLFRGIDVSRWQGDINWSQVAADDVSFVMLGTRSKGAVDPYFHRNIQQASAAGVKVGVYIYSLATTPEMAVDEANFVLT